MALQDWLTAEEQFLRVAPERRIWTDSIAVRAFNIFLARTACKN